MSSPTESPTVSPTVFEPPSFDIRIRSIWTRMSEAGQHARGSEAGAEVGRFDELVGLDQGVRLHTHGSDSEQASAGRVPACTKR
mmetsp:Transcript_15192/g.18493  ORF Transcript_15192/g.18493 Transcript_15192/m.18493 type:complete len:84 (-) Transcript_15192:450-701(-)